MRGKTAENRLDQKVFRGVRGGGVVEGSGRPSVVLGDDALIGSRRGNRGRI